MAVPPDALYDRRANTCKLRTQQMYFCFISFVSQDVNMELEALKEIP